ncbi:MAG: thioredoxin family protein [Labilithrix sp.]
MRKAPALGLLLVLAACTPKSNDEIKADVASPAVPSSVVTTAAGSATSPPADRPRIVVQPAEADSDAISAIRTARLQAKAQGRVLVVFVSAVWCPPCKKMKSEIDAGNLDARLGKTTLLAFDADRDEARLKAAGYTFKFIPFVALPGPDGAPADSQQATGEGKDAWRELLGKLDAWQAAGPR